MTASITIGALVAAVSLPPIPPPHRSVDHRLRRLYDEDVRKDPKRLAAALDDIWKMLPPPQPLQEPKLAEVARHLVRFITLDSPVFDPRERWVGRGTGRAVYSMLLHIGLPAVPALLQRLLLTADDTKEGREHREAVAACLVAIYDKGGKGRELAAERIRLFAEGFPPKEKQRILSTLEYNSFKSPPPPVDRPPGKQ